MPLYSKEPSLRDGSFEYQGICFGRLIRMLSQKYFFIWSHDVSNRLMLHTPPNCFCFQMPIICNRAILHILNLFLSNGPFYFITFWISSYNASVCNIFFHQKVGFKVALMMIKSEIRKIYQIIM